MRIPFEKVTREEFDLINKIADRAFNIVKFQLGDKIKKIEIVLDLVVCHTVTCPLNLERMLEADQSNFTHDVFGIGHHLNRETFKMEDCFLPRFAKAWN